MKYAREEYTDVNVENPNLGKTLAVHKLQKYTMRVRLQQ